MAPERRGAAERRPGAGGGPTPGRVVLPLIPVAREAISDPHLARPANTPASPAVVAGAPAPGTGSPVAAPAGRRERLAARVAGARASWSSPRVRRGALVAAVALEVALLAGAVVTGLDTTSGAVARPATMMGTVYGVGAGGVNLRSAPAVASSTALTTAQNGASLAFACGITGATVSGPSGDSSLWLRTEQGTYISMLYATIPGRAFVPSCGGPADAALIAMPGPSGPVAPADALPPTDAASPTSTDPATGSRSGSGTRSTGRTGRTTGGGGSTGGGGGSAGQGGDTAGQGNGQNDGGAQNQDGGNQNQNGDNGNQSGEVPPGYGVYTGHGEYDYPAG